MQGIYESEIMLVKGIRIHVHGNILNNFQGVDST